MMYPYIQIIIPSYTFMAVLGALVVIGMIFSRLDRFEIRFTSFLFIVFICGVGCFVGSKLLYAATRLGWLAENFSVKNLLLLIPQSGFVFYGGLFGVIFVLMLYSRKQPELRKKLFRMIVPAMPLFHAFGRVGCFLAGCCYGKDFSRPFKIGLLEFTKVPVQLIEAIEELVLFAVIMVFDKKKENVNLLKIYLISYACIRFINEFYRGDEIRGFVFGLSTSQWISLLILAFYIIKKLYDLQQNKQKI